MRSYVLAGLAVFLLATPLRAQDDEPKPAPLPVNPFATAAPGDWAAYAAHIEMKAADPGMGGGDKTDVEDSIVRWAVTKVDGDDVTVNFAEGPHDDGRDEVLSKKDAPAIQKLLSTWDGSEITELQSADEKHTVGDREFACKKVVFKAKLADQTQNVTMWISSDVKSVGIVEVQISVTAEGTSGTASLKLAGFGTQDKVAWGKATKDLYPPEQPDTGGTAPVDSTTAEQPSTPGGTAPVSTATSGGTTGGTTGSTSTGSTSGTTAPPVKVATNPWKGFGVGSSTKYKLVSEMGATKMEMTITYELVSQDDKSYTTKNTTEMPGMTNVANQQYVIDAGAASGGSSGDKPKIETGKEKVKVAAGEFDCTWTKTTTAQGWTQVWTCDKVPGGVVKTQSEVSGTKGSMELVELKAK